MASFAAVSSPGAVFCAAGMESTQRGYRLPFFLRAAPPLALRALGRAAVRAFGAGLLALAAATSASVLSSPPAQYSHARSTGPGWRVWPAASEASPAVNAPTTPSACARN